MYDTESTDLFQVKKGSYLATVEVNATQEIWERFAGSGLVPNEDSESRLVFETDGNNWNRYIIPDTYGNKSNKEDNYNGQSNNKVRYDNRSN